MATAINRIAGVLQIGWNQQEPAMALADKELEDKGSKAHTHRQHNGNISGPAVEPLAAPLASQHGRDEE